ncbi:MAG: sodium:calcium antiporter, partial [Thermodesulfobacteriota bacterium]
MIGLTIVGFGTSAPEMIVSGVAAWQGNPGLSVGNAIGSNITNIALVLGVTSMITPLTVHSQTLKRELPVLLAVMALSLLLLSDGNLSRMDGVILLAGFGGLLYWMTLIGIRSRECNPDPTALDEACDPLAMEFAEEVPEDLSLAAGLL